MSTVIQPFINRLKSIEDRLPIYANKIVLENAELLIHLITQNQLAKGKDTSGSIVGVYFWTTEYKHAKDPYNRPREEKITGQPYNFDWTGELFETLSVRANANKGEFSIFSVSGKIDRLEKIYNTNLSDLTEENNNFFNLTVLLPELQKIILYESVVGLI
tara:strand:- start:10560 stop:11039 length:480 start_codon:yes stop_codon:yes gene_type:complete